LDVCVEPYSNAGTTCGGDWPPASGVRNVFIQLAGVRMSDLTGSYGAVLTKMSAVEFGSMSEPMLAFTFQWGTIRMAACPEQKVNRIPSRSRRRISHHSR